MTLFASVFGDATVLIAFGIIGFTIGFVLALYAIRDTPVGPITIPPRAPTVGESGALFVAPPPRSGTGVVHIARDRKLTTPRPRPPTVTARVVSGPKVCACPACVDD